MNPVKSCALALAYGRRIVSGNPYDRKHTFRNALVTTLAESEPSGASAVVPIPSAGKALAEVWAATLGVEVWHAFASHADDWCMFHLRSQDRRIQHASRKVGQVSFMRSHKAIYLIDETIVTGTSMRLAISSLRNSGVKHIFARTILPPLRSSCPYGVLASEELDFIGHCVTDYKDIARDIGADDFRTLEVAFFQNCLTSQNLCTFCATALPPK